MRNILSRFSLAAVTAVLALSFQLAAPAANAVDLGPVSLGVSLDTTYQYVSDGKVGTSIPERGLYPEHNDFSIDAVTLSLEKTPTTDGDAMDFLGFRADILFGEQAERLGFGFGRTANDDDPTDGAVSPYQAYVNVLLPTGGSGINVYAGQFTTLAGWELIEAKDNTNITRSLLFYRIPFAHSGVRATTSAGMLDFALGVSNDWDALDDTNDEKTFEGQVALNLPSDGWLGVTGYFGKTSADDGDESNRTLVTAVGSVTLMEKLTLIGDFEYTSWNAGGDRWGVAGYAIMSVSDAVSVALRGEYVDDEEIKTFCDPSVDCVNNTVVETGIMGVKLYEVTSTLILSPFDGKGNFETRLEYRYDRASGDDTYFAGKKHQHGFAVQLLYWLDV